MLEEGAAERIDAGFACSAVADDGSGALVVDVASLDIGCECAGGAILSGPSIVVCLGDRGIPDPAGGVQSKVLVAFVGWAEERSPTGP